MYEGQKSAGEVIEETHADCSAADVLAYLTDTQAAEALTRLVNTVRREEKRNVKIEYLEFARDVAADIVKLMGEAPAQFIVVSAAMTAPEDGKFKSLADIAKETGKSKSTVNSLLMQAAKKYPWIDNYVDRILATVKRRQLIA